MKGSGEIISTDPGGSSIIIIYIEEGFYLYRVEWDDTLKGW